MPPVASSIPSCVDPARRRLRVGIVGAGRTRQGLGPFLAQTLVRAGCDLVGVAGRDQASAERAAAALAPALGQPVAAFATATELASRVDALVVAAPVPGHLGGLDAALAAGVPCLCEKPLVAADEVLAGLQRIALFRERNILLVENCQWPFVLPAFHQLWPQRVGAPVHHVAMGLGPGWPGPAMVVDSLSHVLSLVQAVAPLRPDAMPTQVRQHDGGPTARRDLVEFTLAAAHGPIEVALHLEHTPAQPRPAWFAIDGARIDRRLGPDYAHSYVRPDGAAVNLRDPLHQLVYGFVSDLATPNRDRTTALADVIAFRLRCYAHILAALGIASRAG